jgi:dihydrofolate reductase
MRKITAGMFISLDGVVEDPQDWHFPWFNEEMGRAVEGQLGNADTLLLGRKTYEGFAEAWPGREDAGGDDAPMAKKLGDARKIVVTHHDHDLPWRNSEVLKGDLVEGVKALKAEPGDSAIGISGSVSVVRQLVEAGELDELHLLVHPVVVGKGLRLFEDSPQIPLKVLSSETFTTGVLYVVYGPDTAPPTGGYDEAVQSLSNADS